MPILSAAEISKGSQFPPARERSRVNEMDKTAMYVNRRFGLLTPGRKDRLQPNMFRFIADFWRDAVMSDPPALSVNGNDRVQAFVKALSPSLFSALENVVSDIAKFGTGILAIRTPGLVESLEPRHWFPIRAADDLNKGDADIIAFPYSDRTENTEYNKIHVTLLQGGVSVTRRHSFSGMTVGGVVEVEDPRPAGNPSLVPVRVGEGFYGTSFMVDIPQYVEEMFRRETGVSEALDKHQNPHLALPEAAIQVDEAGRVVVQTEGMAIPMPDDATVPPQYITWDPSFAAQTSAIERAESRILRLAAISPVLVDHDKAIGSLASGVALRRLAVPTVNRVRSIRLKLDEAIRTAITSSLDLLGRSGGERVSLDRDDIRILWSPELSTSMFDDAEALTRLVESGVLDAVAAAQIVVNATPDEAEGVVGESTAAQQARITAESRNGS